MTAAMRTDIGKVRSQNEDSVWMDISKGIFAVADGMGGHLAGEVASGMAVEILSQMDCHRGPDLSILKETIRQANERIYSYSCQHPECSGMGTTLSVMWHAGRYMYIGHVGDSRIYRLRGNDLEQITQDHSLVEELVRARLITREEARVHPRRNVITRALGTEDQCEADMLAALCCEGDTWLICSDGLCGYVEDEKIRETLRSANSVNEAADDLIALALDAGGKDNVSVVVCRVEEDQTWKAD